MAQAPLKEEISAPYPNPSNAVMRVGMGKLWDWATGLLGTEGTAADARATLGAMASNSGNISASAGGSANAITATFSPAITSLTPQLTVYVRAASANTTTTPTFQANSTTAKTIVKGANAALVAGDIAGAGHILILQYDSTLDKWILQNPAKGVSFTDASTTDKGIIEIATSAETAALSDATRAVPPAYLGVGAKSALNASGDAPIYAARAYLNANGTGVPAIRKGGNISSITDFNVGYFRANFTVAMNDQNYTMVRSVDFNSTADAGNLNVMEVISAQTAYVDFITQNASGGAGDPLRIEFAIFD